MESTVQVHLPFSIREEQNGTPDHYCDSIVNQAPKQLGYISDIGSRANSFSSVYVLQVVSSYHVSLLLACGSMASRYHATSTLHCARFLACYCAGHLRLLRAEKIVEPSRNLVRREVNLDLAVGGPHQGPLPGVVAPHYLPAVVCSSVMSRWKGACACGCREVLLCVRAWVRACCVCVCVCVCMCVCVCILTTSAPKPSPTAFALQGTILFTHWSPSLHSTLALCLVSLSPEPPSTFTAQYSLLSYSYRSTCSLLLVLVRCSAPLVPVLGHIVPVLTNFHSCQIFLCRFLHLLRGPLLGCILGNHPKGHCFGSL